MKNKNYLEVVTYNSNWPIIFQNESSRLRKVLDKNLSAIYHIGSTSIPNMPPKPIIDIFIAIDDIYNISYIAEKLIDLGYAPVRRQIIPHVSFITNKFDEVSFNLHLHERGSPQINRHVNFRDYVIQHPKVAKEYAELKLRLAQQYADNVFAYVSSKSKLVQEIDIKAKVWQKIERDYPLPNTGPLANTWSIDKILKAMEANLNLLMTYFAQYLDEVELIRIPGYTLVNSGLTDDTFNYVIDADFASEDAQIKISEVTDYFHQKNLPFSWWVSPCDQPENLSVQLENYGYCNTENNCAMYLDLDVLNDDTFAIPELKIIRATNEKTLRDFALVLANDEAVFKNYFSWISSILTDEDPIEYYVGYINDKPVVRGLSCYFAQVAGFYWLSTAPSERRNGYGRAMQAYQLKRAKKLGYHVAVLQASREGYPLYQQVGYNECGYFREYKK